MVSIDNIKKGVAAYLDSELMPQLNKTGIERVIIGTGASLLIQRAGNIIEGYKDNKFVQMLGVMDLEGNIDVAVLVEELKKNIPKEGFTIDVPVIGVLTFHKEDVDRLNHFIMEV